MTIRLSDRNSAVNHQINRLDQKFTELLLADPQLTRSEVASLVGFRDPSALRKAMRRWGLDAAAR